MAQKVNIILVDDLTGEEADSIQTVQFAVDGDQYEIDLTEENAATFRSNLAVYTEKGRVTQRRRGRKPQALAEAQAKAVKGKGGTRRRTSTVEQIEAGKS